MHGETPLARRLRAAYLALSLIYLAAVIWMILIPEHRRTEAKLRAYRSCAQVMSRLSRRTADVSMGHELATGQEAYGLPYRLALARDALGRAYDRARDVTA